MNPVIFHRVLIIEIPPSPSPIMFLFAIFRFRFWMVHAHESRFMKRYQVASSVTFSIGSAKGDLIATKIHSVALSKKKTLKSLLNSNHDRRYKQN